MLEQLPENKYRIRYYVCKAKSQWKKAIGKHNSAIISKDMIIYAGVVLNQDQTLSVGSLNHINAIVELEQKETM